MNTPNTTGHGQPNTAPGGAPSGATGGVPISAPSGAAQAQPPSPNQQPALPLQVLVVDDEALARARLRTLLADCQAPAAVVAGEAAEAVAAMQWLAHHRCDVVLLDIHLPGTSGLQLAHTLRGLPQPPAVVFVTAHAEHAVQAFELEVLDYLTKPVRLERLQTALRKAELRSHAIQAQDANLTNGFLRIQDRGRTERVPLADIQYLKAELKYVTVRTASRSLIYDGSLAELEARHGSQWLRIHRNALVARHAIRALERYSDPADPDDKGDGWAVRLTGVPEPLAVSRRQLAAVREVLAQG